MLLTVGHGRASADGFATLLRGAAIEAVVDVRTAPGSRRHPHFTRAAMESWLPEAGIAYRWESRLGGWRRPRPDSPNGGLRHEAFRGYADHMASDDFRAALEQVAAEARERRLAVMCSESLWWRCHRRLLADAAVLLLGLRVEHLGHDGRRSAHEPTPEALMRAGTVVYPPAGQQLELTADAAAPPPRP